MEHGSSSLNRFGQKQYPRKRFFDQIIDMIRQSKRTVLMFVDKHLDYPWDRAKETYDMR